MTNISLGAATAPHPTATPAHTFDTGFGRVRLAAGTVRLGELFVTDDGVEVEVVGLEPLVFAQAPEEDEDWGE